MNERVPDDISLSELLAANALREASIKADLAIACRIRNFASFPAGYDFSELLAHIEQIDKYNYPKPLILDWQFIRDLGDLLFSRMFGSLRRAPETGDWIEWMQFTVASWSLLMLCVRQTGKLGNPSITHLARVLKFVNV